jgi:glycerophosphoryl diester phosphodiesterase
MLLRTSAQRICLLLSLAAMIIGMSSGQAVEIIAHRGASADAPENTLSAMRLAWEQKADAIELDIYLSKDGKVLVFHDTTTKRMSGEERKISDYTWDEAAKLDVGAWKGPQFAGERIPTLDSILATVPSGGRAVIEIKCGPEVVPEMARIVAASGKTPEQLAVISFKYDSLAASQKRLPKIPHYLLSGYKKDEKTGEFPKVEPLIQKAKAAGFAGLNLHFDWPIDAAFVNRLKGEGLKTLVWTVNNADIARRLSAAGVDAITTDRPAWLREQLAK